MISTQVPILTPEGLRGREKAGGFASFEEAFTFEQGEDEHFVTIQLCDQVCTSSLRPHTRALGLKLLVYAALSY